MSLRKAIEHGKEYRNPQRHEAALENKKERTMTKKNLRMLAMMKEDSTILDDDRVYYYSRMEA